MEIKKIFNNNVVLTENENKSEMVIMGRGLAFQKKAGDLVDPAKIEKSFVLEKKGISDKIAELLKDISEQYLAISEKIISYAKSQLDTKFDDYLYIALTDHISFAVNRHKQGLHLKNALLWEIKKYYKKEFEIGLKALTIIEEEIGIKFEEHEAVSIAMHLVNGQIPSVGMQSMVKVTNIVTNILSIVKYHYKIELDEDSISYERFITHLRFFAIRLIRKDRKMYTNEIDFLFEQVKVKYKEAFVCSEKIAVYVQNTYKNILSNDELLYLALHIQRVTKRQND